MELYIKHDKSDKSLETDFMYHSWFLFDQIIDPNYYQLLLEKLFIVLVSYINIFILYIFE